MACLRQLKQDFPDDSQAISGLLYEGHTPERIYTCFRVAKQGHLAITEIEEQPFDHLEHCHSPTIEFATLSEFIDVFGLVDERVGEESPLESIEGISAEIRRALKEFNLIDPEQSLRAAIGTQLSRV